MESEDDNQPSGKRKLKDCVETVEELCDTSYAINSEEQDADPLEDTHGKYQKYNKDNKWKLDQIPHHLLPSYNLTQCTDINNIREFPLLRVSLPHSVFVCSNQANDVDVCHRRTIAYAAYMNRLKRVKTAYTKAKKKNKQVRKDEKNGIYTTSFITFAKRRDINPDIYFERDYDFYYTGGNLSANPETNQILHASGNNMERLTLSEFNVEDNIPKLHKVAGVYLTAKNGSDESESEIFETQFCASKRDFFFVRRKRCISYHQYTDGKFYTLKKFRTKEVPLISFAQNKVNTNHMVLSNLEHQVRLYDIEKGLPIQASSLMSKEDFKPATNWNMIRSIDCNVYIYASCRKVNIIDTRIPDIEWRSNYCSFDSEDHCSNFCSVAVSNFDNLFYAGSNHKVYCVDRRYMGKNIDNKNTAVSRWTHQMSSCPLMMATSRYEDCEYITLQSPLSADLRICENIQYLAESDVVGNVAKKACTELPPEYLYKSPCLPYMPPSLESVFQEARKNGKCIKTITGIVDRIKACNIGLAFAGNSSNPYILTATSNGDLFARHMFVSNSDDCKEEKAADVMSRFEENIFSSVKRPPLQFTEVCDLSGISKVFRCPQLSVTQVDETLTIPQKRLYMGRWQKSVSSLYKYKDALASDLLSIWDVEPEDEKNFNITSLSKSAVTDANSFVTGWLNSAQEIAHSTMLNMTSIPMEELNRSEVPFDSTIEEIIAMNDSVVDETTEQTINVAKAKATKKKTQYIKGF